MEKSGSLILVFVGAFLMAFCGSQLSRLIDIGASHGWVMPGFAVGIVLLAQAPTVAFRARLAKLEREID